MGSQRHHVVKNWGWSTHTKVFFGQKDLVAVRGRRKRQKLANDDPVGGQREFGDAAESLRVQLSSAESHDSVYPQEVVCCCLPLLGHDIPPC